MEYLFIYGLDLIDGFSFLYGTFIFILIGLILVFIIYTAGNWEEINCIDGYNKNIKTAHKKFKIFLIKCIVAVVLFTFIPSKETILLMGGVYYGKKAANAVVTSDKLEKVNTIIDLQLDKYIKELQGAVK